MESKDAGWSNANEALPAPPDYFEVRFTPEANKPYRVWMRLRAAADSKFNDSVWVQFSGAVDADGRPLWRIGTTSALLLNLESCTACGVSGWGWQTGAWWVLNDSLVRFPTVTEQTLRVQTREDGARIDQIVLGATKYFDSPPGTPINDTTIVPKKSGATTTPPIAPGGQSATAGKGKPTTSITSPENGAVFSAPATIQLTASAADADGTVTRLDFYTGTQVLYTRTSSPWTYTWRNVPAGKYVLKTAAVDNAGGVTDSAPVTITVSNTANPSPVATITSPSDGATFTAPATITINATSSDSNVSRVEFYAGTQLLGTAATAPYTVTWSNAPAGTHALTAVARGNGVASASSAAVDVIVKPAGPPPPAGAILTFTPSRDHDSTVTSYSVAIFRAGDPATATPVGSTSLGKPALSNGEISVNISGMVNALPSGWYYVVVTAHGRGGVAASMPSTPFPK